MTDAEDEWSVRLNDMLIDDGNAPILIRIAFGGKWLIECSFSDDPTGRHDHAYQAVNEWNEKRRGEK